MTYGTGKQLSITEAYFLDECDDRDVLFTESGEEVTNYDN